MTTARDLGLKGSDVLARGGRGAPAVVPVALPGSGSPGASGSLAGTNGAGKLLPIEPKRVLFFGKKKSRSCCTGALVEALRSQGLSVRWVNCALLRRWLGTHGMRGVVRLLRRAYRPDICFVFFHDLPPLLMAELSAEVPTVVWMEEQTKFVDSEHIDYVRQARLLCLSTPSLVRAYRSHGIHRATFLMSGFSPRYHRPASGGMRAGAFDRDLAFIGGPGHMGDRPAFLSWLSERHELEIFGRKDSWLPHLRRHPNLSFAGEVRPRGYARVCARSKIVLGLNQNHDARLYFSNRLFLTLACGGFHLTHYVPGMEELFGNGVHLAWFRDREDCLAQIDRYLGGEDAERIRIAHAGAALALRAHKYDDRIGDVLAILRGERDLACPDEDDAMADPMAVPGPPNRASPPTNGAKREAGARLPDTTSWSDR